VRLRAVVAQHERAEPALAAGADGHGGLVEAEDCFGLDGVAEHFNDGLLVDRRSGADAAGGGCAGDVGNDEIALAGQRIGGIEAGAAAVGEAVAARGAGLLGDPVGIGAR
jgi:hypothetical protein